MNLPDFFYTDFAYSRTMEIILFFIVNVSNFIFAYIITSTLFNTFMVKTSCWKKLCFAVLTVLFQAFMVYVPYALNGFNDIGIFVYFVSTPNPLFSLLQFFLCIKLIKIPKHIAINMVLYIYLFALLLLSLSRIINFSIFRQADGQYNYMIDAGSAIMGALLNTILYQILSRLTDKKNLIIDLTDNIFVGSLLKRTLFIITIEIVIYSGIVFTQLYRRYDSFGMLLISIILVLSMILNMLRLMHSTDGISLQNKAAHINTLSNVINDFRAVKHDFYNVLATYSGYISLDDLKGLKRYHEKLMSTTVAAGDQLEIVKNMDQNPSLCALLIQKSEKAEELGITMHTALHCKINDISMDNFDLCRILANLLDNAIEASSETEVPNVSFSIEEKVSGDKLIVITNTVKEEVDISKIATLGFTTKANHSGIGLSQTRDTIAKYKNCGIHFTCYGPLFSSYIEIKKT